MPTFDSNGVSIHYVDEGSGPTIVLVHGFAANLELNWRAPKIIDALIAAGRRVVAIDCRGHGESGKPHDPDAYGGMQMADDVIAMMDHVGIDVADLMGYSMGGMLSASLLVRHPQRFRSVILSGIGDSIVTGALLNSVRTGAMAAAMEAKDAEAVATEDTTARNFRLFADRTGADVGALAAMQRSTRGTFDPAKLADVTLPVMVLIGEGDTLVGSADKLAAAIPGAKFVKVPGDHLTAVGAPALKSAVLGFLAAQSPVVAA
jgi:pimeloyl-ACP methyl ester carboxylesterase